MGPSAIDRWHAHLNAGLSLPQSLTTDAEADPASTHGLTIAWFIRASFATSDDPPGRRCAGTARQAITASGNDFASGTLCRIRTITNTTGLTISGSGTGAIGISGTPTAAGTVIFTVTPTDSIGAGAGQVYSFVVNSAVAPSVSSLPAGEAGIAYSQSITTTGGTAPIILVVIGGCLRNTTGLGDITGSGTGAIGIAGTPTAAGTVSFTVTPSDAFGASAGQLYSFVVNPAVVLSPITLPGGVVGTSYSQSITSSERRWDRVSRRLGRQPNSDQASPFQGSGRSQRSACPECPPPPG